jgi:membrane protein DedA with SNARE-associated domain
VSGLLDPILNAPGWAVLAFVALVVFAEDALFVGFVLPGETAAVLGGVAATRGHVSLASVLVVVVGAAIVGDTVGYAIGRKAGVRVLRLGVFDNHRSRLDDARDLLARRGGSAVFLGRWVAFFRAVMPALAGTARMRYSKFLAYNAAGGLVWGVGVVLVGYFAGKSYAKVEQALGKGVAVIAVVIVLAAVVTWRVRKRRRESVAAGRQR